MAVVLTVAARMQTIPAVSLEASGGYKYKQ
jgi:hypothetical protein